MEKTYRPLDETTLDDAIAIVRERFPASAGELIAQALRNPSRPGGAPIGTVGYRDGRPVAMQMQTYRAFCLGKSRHVGIAGGMTCKTLKGCPLSILLATIDRSLEYVPGELAFGNTCGEETARMNAAQGSAVGPDSCHQMRFGIVRWSAFLWYMLNHRVFRRPAFRKPLECVPPKEFEISRKGFEVKRLFRFEDGTFDDLWRRYLAGNEGLVLSRTAAELNWVFGASLEQSKAVLLGAYRGGELCGYIVLTPDGRGRKWKICDMLAIGNDLAAVDALLGAAMKFLKGIPLAMWLEVIGFPDYAQEAISRHLPLVKRRSCNAFSYAVGEEGIRAQVAAVVNTEKSWFFGPYDGDECMG